MQTSTIFNDKHTQDYYDSFGSVYEAVWNEQIHTGYFANTQTLPEAVQAMNGHLVNIANMPAGSVVLTLGCGRGGVDRFLAREHGVTVIGIDLSQQQLAEARRRMSEEGLAQSITYIQASMTDIPLADSSVNYVWLQESFFHCHNKQKAAEECFRVLTPGGRVIMEDTVLSIVDAENEVLTRFGQRVGVNAMLTPEQYVQVFQGAGFVLEKQEDVSNHLAKTYAAIVEYISNNQAKVRAKVPTEFLSRVENSFGFPGSLQLVKEGKLGCFIFLFIKP